MTKSNPSKYRAMLIESRVLRELGKNEESERLYDNAWALYRTMTAREREVCDQMERDNKVKASPSLNFRDRDRPGYKIYKLAGIDN